MKILKFPFLSLSIFFVLGILSDPFLTKSRVIVFLYLTSCALLARIGSRIYAHVFYRCSYWICYAMIFWSLGVLTASLHSVVHQKHHYQQQLNKHTKQFLKLLILEKLRSNQFSHQYVAELTQVDKKVTFGKVLVIVPIKYDNVSRFIGEQLHAYQSVEDIKKPLNPYQFDYNKYMERKGVFGQVYLTDQNVVSVGRRSSFLSAMARWRDEWIRSFEVHQFDPEVLAIVKALVFGQRQELSTELKSNFSRVGVIHVLAISGLHIGILYFFILKFLRLFRMKIRVIYTTAVVVLWLFALFSGFAPPVVRAVTMFTLFALTKLLRRSQSGANSLAISFFAMLCFNPNYIYEVGFQLSFLAVFSIVYFYPIIQSSVRSKWLVVQYFKEIMAVSLVVQIGILPLSIYYFHEIPLLFLVGNVVVIPLITLILGLLLGLLFLNYLSVELALVVGQLVSGIIDIMNAVVALLGQMSIYNLHQLSSNGFLTLFGVLSLVFAGYVIKVRKSKYLGLLLLMLLTGQVVYMVSVFRSRLQTEALLLFDRVHTTIVFKQQHLLDVYSSNLEVLDSSVIKEYCRERYIKVVNINPIQGLVEIKGKRVLLIDSTASYQTALKADVLIFVAAAKINYHRIIDFHQPELVVTAANFSVWESGRLSEFCLKKNIPFHSVSEKGYYKF